MNIPTVGRRVWYWPHDRERSYAYIKGDALQAFDAGVARANEDGTINVSIINDMGYPIPPRQNVVLHDTPEEASPGECSWMPYQNQKAKEEARATVLTTGDEAPKYEVPGEPLPGSA